MTDRHDPASLTIERRSAAAKTSSRTNKTKRTSAMLVVASDDEALLERTELWLSLLRDRLVEADEQQILSLVEAALPSIEPQPTPAALRQASRNAQARASLLQEFGALSAEQVHELAGSKARNHFALATRWRQEGRIFGVNHGNKTYYPGFQFDADGQPLTIISDVIAAFGENSDGWQTALWFTLANGWLGGQRPVDLLRSDLDGLLDAARQETADAY